MESMNSSPKNRDLIVVVCGGGHGGHAFSAFAGSRQGVKVRWFSLSQAESIKQALGTDELQAEVVERSDTERTVLRSRPTIVTSEPGKCIPGAHVVVFSMPACRHAEYFEKIAPFLEDGTVVVGMPGKLGFEIEGSVLLGKHGVSCSLLCFETLPWACRTAVFGRSVSILGVKEHITTSITTIGNSQVSFDMIRNMQRLLGPLPAITVADNFFVPNLFTCVHPAIMYGQWKDWDGKPLPSKPLFYHGISQFSADMLCKMSDEVVQISRAIAKAFPGLDMSGVLHVSEWYKKAYFNDISDWSSLRASIASCKAYEGLTHPMKEQNDGLVPDFDHRYLTEDLPYSLCVVRGIAELAGIKTPAIDETILWAQNILKKQYLIDGSLRGKDVQNTRAPQAYSITSLEELTYACAKGPRPSRPFIPDHYEAQLPNLLPRQNTGSDRKDSDAMLSEKAELTPKSGSSSQRAAAVGKLSSKVAGATRAEVNDTFGIRPWIDARPNLVKT